MRALLTMVVALAVLPVSGGGAGAATTLNTPTTRPASPAPTTMPALLPRPTVTGDLAGCVTSQCHPGIKAHKVIHGPIATNACDNCHHVKDVKTHTFELLRQKAELCTYCHEFSTAGKPVVHKPVTLGECDACHDPHGGEGRSLLRDASVADTCRRCHDDVSHGAKFQHSPVAKGACDTCHPPHASRFPKLLDAVGVDLCLTCHRDFDARMSQARFRHKAIDEGCTKCHDPHGSSEPMALRQPVTQLCLSCHPKTKDQIAQAQDKHSVVMSERGCLNCHTSHGGDLANLLADIPAKSCMVCHKEPIATKDGRTIAATPEITDPKAYKHGSVREGQCNGCHDVHGGPRSLLLDRAYSAKVYLTPDSDEYALCLKCHDARMIRDPKTPTGFRNGEQNLHLVHVSTGLRGHNCRACHATHAAANDRLLRETMPLGKWQVPIGFQRTATGGSCNTGCHLGFAYDREHPVQNPAPTTQPNLVARAVIDDPPFKSWTGTDAQGATVKIPDPARPTVVLMIGPEVTQAEQLLTQVKQALGPAPKAQVVLVVAGPEAQTQARTLSENKTVSWPVIADAKGILADQLGVRGWPTTVVLRSTGEKVAVVAGVPASLALRLTPYIDLAAGQGDRSTLDQHPVMPGLITDSPERQIEWSLQMARQLLDAGQSESAQKILTDAIKAHGPTASLQAAMARTLIQLGRGAEALTLLDQPQLAAWDPAQRDALRGRALVALKEWDQAREALSAALVRNPDLAEAHYLLGEVYEHGGEWQKAAAEYRAYHDLVQGKKPAAS